MAVTSPPIFTLFFFSARGLLSPLLVLIPSPPMATRYRSYEPLVFSLILLLLCNSSSSIGEPSTNILSKLQFDSIYQFGDSISDVGNLMREIPFQLCAQSPYGETYFGKPTGRCSNGLLMIDYFTIAFKLPFLNPYLNHDADFTHGVNFAVAGATALNNSRNPIAPRSSLPVQLRWFETHLESICPSPSDCKKKFQRSLFMMGEIGGNDYNYALIDDESIQEVMKIVPDVIQAITDAVKEVISRGAIHVVVPGNFPIGCLPIFLTAFGSKNKTKYDKIGCVKSLNEFSKYHNKQLKQAIKKLQNEYPNVNIYYGDYYTGASWVLKNAASLGFDKDKIFEPCCGNTTLECGSSNEVQLCTDPAKRMSWDGTHPTQEAYRHLSRWLLAHTFNQPIHYPVLSPSPSPVPPPQKGSGTHVVSIVLLRVIVAPILALWAIGLKLF